MNAKLRAPSVPLITIDPYFSVWSPADRLTDRDTTHWTDRANLILGVATIDGVPYRFIGRGAEPAMEQADLDITATSSTYTFRAAGVELVADFTSALLLDDLDLLTRPVSFLEVRASATDGKKHDVSVKIALSEQFCLDKEGDSPVEVRKAKLAGGLADISMGAKEQKILARSGDNLRIEWGRVHLAAEGAKVSSRKAKKVTFLTANVSDHDRRNPPSEATADLAFIAAEKPVALGGAALFLFGYDDLAASLEVFGKRVPSVWNRDGKTIETALAEAAADYPAVRRRCAAFSKQLAADARKAGGARYADIVALAYRQAIAAHKLVVNDKGELLLVSKENFSNGCAVTVDVSYPSIPLFLLYRPELVLALMRPIYEFAAGKDWTFDFAPHDAGQYPLVNGQVYGRKADGTYNLAYQMPVEECGNMLVMEAAAAIALGDASFAAGHLDVLRQWVNYLEKNGIDPENQLCTDDFAGHLAHNCNLTLKAIMGVASFSILLKMLGEKAEAKQAMAKAREMAKSWRKRAANPDGTFRLGFDRPGSFSLKYNAVWDGIFGTRLFPDGTFDAELRSYVEKQLPYGIALDDRKRYTKSDWLVWAASLPSSTDVFATLVSRLWDFYHYTPDRVPMTDWYWVDTGNQVGFQARSVQGGLFMRMLVRRGL